MWPLSTTFVQRKFQDAGSTNHECNLAICQPLAHKRYFIELHGLCQLVDMHVETHSAHKERHSKIDENLLTSLHLCHLRMQQFQYDPLLFPITCSCKINFKPHLHVTETITRRKEETSEGKVAAAVTFVHIRL